ncbi:MAG: flagellar basal body P-ring formation protein FlgA [Maritimibacter sp.]|nr:flagellar basal body P-ring formation protein FlgA [Maritimibacter sp.]
MLRLAIFLGLLAAPAFGDTVIAARTIRAQELIGPLDVKLAESDVDGAYADLEAVIGTEARVALYAGRPVRSGEVGPPALIERNQLVGLIYQAGGLTIVAEGRALGRAGVGEYLKVMNLESRQTISGYVRDDGVVLVGTSATTLFTN